ncbi:MAG TPA: aspartate/glutamate racemase family protein [Bryobacteraceae bacterium]|nr:aspartate/glutamate racemase family protein [Bryobacteraceae bacterium]
MSSKRVAFVNTVTTLPSVFKALVNELAPQLDVFSIVDESLLQNTIRSGELTKPTILRLVNYLSMAQQAGADIVMVTCSSIGPAADIGRSLVDIPVLRVDEAMAERALECGSRIGVAATLSTTLKPTADLIQRKASEAGKHVTIVSKVCTGAFEALSAGDTNLHDCLVAQGLKELMSQVDVVVLAQASMARIVDSLAPSEKTLPIFSSPRLAVERLAKMVETNELTGVK